MGEFKLSAVLKGHDDDVRGLTFPSPSLVVSASRDTTVRLWRLLSSKPPQYDCSISSHVQSFVNAVTYLPPNAQNTNGLIISGGKDTIIDVRPPDSPPEADAERLLLGHAHNVCALDVSSDGQMLVSGSWDGTARIWSLTKWDCEALLEGHNGSVWAVLAYDRKTIITGCADKSIRLFSPEGKLYGEIKGSQDVVRALCRLPQGHDSGAHFASAGNDAVIRLWTIQGTQIAQLHGHESFIYSLANLPTGELVSSGEDRTVRVWKGNRCVQTITHPAISVWAVSVCPETGDLASGSSDKIVRLFTRDPERHASSEIIAEFEESVKSSAIPKQQVGNINKENLPGPDFLQKKSGIKEGQVQMIREADGSISAHQWSQATQAWLNVGTVVDTAGSSGRRTTFEGKDYDFVFDVDIEDGKPALKLPYNVSQNPYEAATTFLQRNELPMTYLDQVAGFITTNSQGASIGQSSVSGGSDPWGTENRYRPGEGAGETQSTEKRSPRPRVLPQQTYLGIKTANVKVIIKKINEFNQQLQNEGSTDLLLDDKALASLNAICEPLETTLVSDKAIDAASKSIIPIIFRLLSEWPPSMRLPVLDMARLLTAVDPYIFQVPGQDHNVVDLLVSTGLEDKDRQNHVMLAIRGLANSFLTQPGQVVMAAKAERVLTAVERFQSSSNRSVLIALTTLYINYAVSFSRRSADKDGSVADLALSIADGCTKLVKGESDPETIYRALVAIGTLLGFSEDVLLAANDIFGLQSALSRVERELQEPRIRTICNEVRDELNGMR